MVGDLWIKDNFLNCPTVEITRTNGNQQKNKNHLYESGINLTEGHPLSGWRGNGGEDFFYVPISATEIEQDYMDDSYAFQINAPRPVRIHLKTGKIVSELDDSIIKYNGKMIDGGAATVLDLPLNKTKTLKHLKLQTIANDVVIGLTSVGLVR